MRKILLGILFVLGGAVLALTLRATSAHALVPSGPPVPGIDQVQQATNQNRTEQQADATALTKQANVNAPISVLSFDANNGDVNQQNAAETNAKADNQNATDQGVVQDQQAAATGSQDGSIDQHQEGTNENSTEQQSQAKAETKQANINLPISVLSFGANNGDVQQGNWAETNAKASNDNDTDQFVLQQQPAKSAGQDGKDTYGQSWDGKDGYGKKTYDGGGRDGIEQKQEGSNANETEQQSQAKAQTKQSNVNLPVSVLSFGSNNGNVDQQNGAVTNAKANNDNGTDQFVGQGQFAKASSPDVKHIDDAYGMRDGKFSDAHGAEQRQEGSNSNETSQDAKAKAETKQVNVNAPISVLSFGSNNGNVEQGNWADTNAKASNDNDTDQGVLQSQQAKASTPPKGDKHDDGKDGYSKHGHDQSAIDQKQRGSNENETEQESKAKAETKQVNVNAPISVLSFGTNNGKGSYCLNDAKYPSTQQWNAADTNAKAKNENWTDQLIAQDQWARKGGAVW